MCGIAGVVSRDPAARSPVIVARMARAIAHRGPDDEAMECRADATLAVRRLAIIDIAGGRQPMSNEAGDVWAAQNGEIYNFAELRRALAERGHRFRTRSDTEVLPHAYEEWGDAFAARLHGMFAVGIWDERRRRLVMARDRFGKKPLVYAEFPGGLAFASEIGALLAHPAVVRDVDVEAISDYLVLGYVPAPRTAFLRIRKLPPAHVLVYEQGAVVLQRYWSLPFGPKLRIGFEEAAEEIRRLIDDAVRIRLVSDVPIGVFLSGGLDSSAVAAFMARHVGRPIKTFSIGFRDHGYDELRYARVVARAFGTEHHEFVVDANQAEDLPMLVRHLGEPFADSSIVPTHQVARITRESVKVALNGDGGDELFAGYDRYKAAAIARLLVDGRPGPLVAALAGVARAIPLATYVPRPLSRARRFLAPLALEPESRYLAWTGHFVGNLRRQVLGERLRETDEGEPRRWLSGAIASSAAEDAADRFMAADILMGLPGDLLVKMDIATMAASLEARSPLLDHTLAEFVARLPAQYKLSVRTSKRLLRRAMRGVLPPEILGRGKMGFAAPVGHWLRGPLRPFLEEVVLSDAAAARGFVSAAGARRLFDEHVAGKADRGHLLWNLLMLELWFRECVEAPSEPASRLAPTVGSPR